MIPVTGLFASSSDALRAADSLKSHGIPVERISVLIPNKAQPGAKSLPVTDAEQPGIGKVMGGVVGGAVGVAAGAEMGALGAALLLPGVGPIIAVGIAAAAILGLGGAVGGAFVGEALDESLTEGLPVDELYVYEDALRKGRSVVIAFAANQKLAQAVHHLLLAEGAESIDSARERWWLGIRDDEQASFDPPQGTSDGDEQAFRAGFETALKPRYRGKPYPAVRDSVKTEQPGTVVTELFKRGYERGQVYLRRWQKRQ
jgi:hypothetical protein